MLVMKFGGTSMGSAGRMCNSVDIICERSKIDRLGVIVSAVGGVSNRLQDSINFAMQMFATAAGETQTTGTAEIVASIRKTHADIITELSSAVKDFNPAAVEVRLELLYAEFDRLLAAIAAFGECPETIECRIMGLARS